METLEQKLKNYSLKNKKRELRLPKDMLREAIGNTRLSLMLDLENVTNDYYDNFENVKKYWVKLPKSIEVSDSDYQDDVIHYVEFYDNKKFYLPFSYVEFYKNKYLVFEWKNTYFPNLKIGDLYYTISPATYLIRDFKELLTYGVQDADWDHVLSEGSIVIVIEKINIDGNLFTKVLYNGIMYWCFGVVANQEMIKGENIHFV